MMEIYSPSNPRILFVKKLADKRARDESGMFFVEGSRNVTDILSAVSYSDVINVFITEKYSRDPVIENYSDKVILTNDICMQRMSDAKTSQGIVAVLRQPRFCTELCDYTLLLDGIADGGNLGTILRTSAAAGYGVILRNCADVFSPKAVRSCMSAIVKVRLYKFDNELISRLKTNGVTFFAGDMSGKNIFSLSRKYEKVCLAIGNEAFGLSQEIRNLCTEKISIPMEDMESLNAAVSAGILMYNLKFGK